MGLRPYTVSTTKCFLARVNSLPPQLSLLTEYSQIGVPAEYHLTTTAAVLSSSTIKTKKEHALPKSCCFSNKNSNNQLTELVRRFQLQEIFDHDTDIREQVDQGVDVEGQTQGQDRDVPSGESAADIGFAGDAHLHKPGVALLALVWCWPIYCLLYTSPSPRD